MRKSRIVTVSALQFACTHDEYGRKVENLLHGGGEEKAQDHDFKILSYILGSSSLGNCYPEMTEVEYKPSFCAQLEAEGGSSFFIRHLLGLVVPRSSHSYATPRLKILSYPTVTGSEPQGTFRSLEPYW
ncbi:uncharacterized protein LOC105170027 [Sesamum indicum]|uniref:Uncharacterized protein LOC105170027 n=1 Tax=Sesamum indicum TaxID=4182 RepID=A0A6I9U4Z2_SESIN|nr:uncharacterized protein LOC105170027 [Sesamum indicum]